MTNARHAGIVHLRIGKNGITEGIVEEIKVKLAQTDPVVIKLLKAFCDTHDRKAESARLAEQTKSRISSLTGGTLVLTRKR